MTFISGTSLEVLPSGTIATGTQLNTFTVEDDLHKTLPPIAIPAMTVQKIGQSFKIRAIGRLGTTGAPTFTWSVRLLTTQTWSAGGILLGSTAALTAGTTQTLAPWELEMDVTCSILARGALSTLRAIGFVRSPLGLASPFAGTIPGNNTAFTVATFDNSLTYYVFCSAACGTSNALNLIQLEMAKVYGE